MSTNDKARRLRFEIFRYNPKDETSEPHTDVFEIDERTYLRSMKRRS
jgi:succinate dehydrogenase/fumarate reductase-like Fe-S protein